MPGQKQVNRLKVPTTSTAACAKLLERRFSTKKDLFTPAWLQTSSKFNYGTKHSAQSFAYRFRDVS